MSLHLETNQHTHHFVNERFLSMMRPSAVLINTARGRLVNTDALVAALAAGHLLGAGIDVYEEEPVPEKDECKTASLRKLLDMNNVVVTPHVGFKTGKALRRLVEESITNVARYAMRVQGVSSATLDVKKNCLIHGPEERRYSQGSLNA